MTSSIQDFAALSNGELLSNLNYLIERERAALPHLLACLSEVDRRMLYADAAYPSLFVFLTKAHRYSEGAAMRRIQAARAARRFPEIYSLLADGLMSLSTVSLLAAHLTDANHDDILAKSQGKNRREVEWIIAGLAPKPDTSDRIKTIAQPSPPDKRAQAVETEPVLFASATTARPEPHQKITPSAPKRVQFSFTGSEELLNGIERAKELLKHKHPAGKLEDVLVEVVEVFLDRKDPDRRLARLDKIRAAQRDNSAKHSSKIARPVSTS